MSPLHSCLVEVEIQVPHLASSHPGEDAGWAWERGCPLGLHSGGLRTLASLLLPIGSPLTWWRDLVTSGKDKIPAPYFSFSALILSRMAGVLCYSLPLEGHYIPLLTFVVMAGDRITVFLCGTGVELLLSEGFLSCKALLFYFDFDFLLEREVFIGAFSAAEMVDISRLLTSGIYKSKRKPR